MMQESSLDREDISVQKGKMFIGDKEYQPRVQPPDPTSVLKLPLQKLNEIMMMEVERGRPIQTKGNTFIPYVACVDSTDQVQDLYMKIRLSHAEARHIICAYSVPGAEVLECSDHCDDEDHGVSKAVLDILLENNISHRAVFIVRNVGDKLHDERISTYAAAAKAILSTHTWNSKTQSDQKIQHSDTQQTGLKSKNTGKGGYVYRGRGRGGGRRGGFRRGRWTRTRQKGSARPGPPTPESIHP